MCIGTYEVWKLSFHPSDSATAKKIVHVKEAQFLNGVTPLNDHTVLISDSGLGVVWRVDINTGEYAIAIDDPLMKTVIPSLPFGINGVHIVHGNSSDESLLYFTCTTQEIFAKVPIHPTNGTAKSPAIVVATTGTILDDFAIGDHASEESEYAYLATNVNNTILKVALSDGTAVKFAGDLGSTSLEGATSAQFGRNGILYVTTNGGIGGPVNGTIEEGGKLAAVRLW